MLSAHLLLSAYAQGIFPMVHEDGELHWHDPDPRAIIPVRNIAPNGRLRRYIRSHGYHCTVDRCFTTVMRHCADREETWIDERMIQAYSDLHLLGHAHSVECWQGDDLIGGIYGVSIGTAFFGESMFSLANNASTAAFHSLIARSRDNGLTLFDTQYINDHTRRLGAIEIPRAEFRRVLARAVYAQGIRWS